MDYKDYNDQELLSYIGENIEEASEIMYEKYKPMIITLANKMINLAFNTGLEVNDFIQEGMLGLNVAIQEYDVNKEASFFTFAKKCIERRMLSLVAASRRQKHRFLNESISFEIADEEGEFKNYDALLEDNSLNPEQLLLDTERENEILKIAHEVLTSFEEQVFVMKMNNFTYKEIADLLDKDPKSIDNAIQRIKAKLKNKLNIDRS